ncbi:hypothetical protein CC2G_001054 [Coprinopsis cinerea AmutBmut pab1-1]|nr:hypothetical protein CC2G_001054 [Coprinopsis cinerea AmutBmut pab1-1]
MHNSHPSLPPRPQTWSQPQQPPSVLQNYFHQNAYSSHYAQAYLQQFPGAQPSTSNYYAQPTPAAAAQHNANKPRPAQQVGAWYQPGNKQCTYKDCRFTGSHKSVELHMMDRHLIYPPGWDKRPKKEEWDADPSLKGKPIPIQGTNLVLDTPESLEAWIAERKKRFPTANRVEDKKRKMEEAVARGQLTAEDMGVRPEKRRRHDEKTTRPENRNNQGNRGNDRKGRAGAAQRPTVSHPLPARPSPPKPSTAVQDDANTSSDSEPEVVTSKAPVHSFEPPQSLDEPEEEPAVPPAEPAGTDPPKPRQQRPSQPKRPLHNPFDKRPPLLRNLLLPEIRVTVSNLSQAIRFLVDNDFLRSVELKPGQAQEIPIQVISSHETGA